MCCGWRLKDEEPSCAWCGTEVDVEKARCVLWYGKPLLFCDRRCQRKWDEDWSR